MCGGVIETIRGEVRETMVDTVLAPGALKTDIYERIGVRTVINGRGATTAVGGSLMRPEVATAMVEATKAFVVIEELNAKVGEKIAEVTGAEAGYVTAGSAAGMLLAVAACIAGTDPVKIAKLPQTEGMKNEVIVHRAHRLNYDQMYRAAGGKLVEIGIPYETHAWELEEAIGERTACVTYVDSRNIGTGALDFRALVEISHARKVPVVVDAASTIPPLDHLRRWIRWGADLVIYSGGKGIRGPQDSGLLAGRADLIAAARANGNPHAAIGRGMKVSKEAMVGLWMALTILPEIDHEADHRAHLAQAQRLYDAIVEREDAVCAIEGDWEVWPAPVLRVTPKNDAWSPRAIQLALMAGDPPVHIDAVHGTLQISTHGLLPGDELVIAERLMAVMP
jgi:D-glucosaminate-6-phosphate ammonia-lyase